MIILLYNNCTTGFLQLHFYRPLVRKGAHAPLYKARLDTLGVTLGVSLDDELSFSSHVRNVCRKASCQTGVLITLRNLIPTSAKLHIVKFAILPHLLYCQTDWHICRSSDARKLERTPRAVYCDNNSTNEELSKRAKLPTVHARRTTSHRNHNV